MGEQNVKQSCPIFINFKNIKVRTWQFLGRFFPKNGILKKYEPSTNTDSYVDRLSRPKNAKKNDMRQAKKFMQNAKNRQKTYPF